VTFKELSRIKTAWWSFIRVVFCPGSAFLVVFFPVIFCPGFARALLFCSIAVRTIPQYYCLSLSASQDKLSAALLQSPNTWSIAPGYLAELCKPVANIDGHRHLWSAGRGQPARRSSSGTVNIRRTRVLLWRNFRLERSSWLIKTRKPCCRKDNRAMRPMYGWPKKVQDSLTTHMATVPEIFNGLLST